MAVVPIIFVHGIQGSWLKNEYPVDYDNEKLWTAMPIFGRKYSELLLSDIDSEVDSDVERFVFPHQAVPLAYESIVDELREEVTPYTYMFTYDWRKDNRLAAERLGQFVELVLKAVSAHERKHNRAVPTKVVLAGHSMGGLVIKWYAMRVLKPSDASKRISKIITIATPYQGSLKAVEALLPGARNLFGVEHQKHMRHASRTMPGVYQLLPSWPGAVVEKDTYSPLDIFDSKNWQRSLVETLAKKYGDDFFPAKLDDAKKFTDVVRKPYPSALLRKQHVVYGVGSDTWHRVSVETDNGNFFDFKNVEENDQGDGTVHSCSSEVDGLPKSRVLKDEAGWGKDILLGQHANMPNHHRVQDWMLKVLKVNPYFASSFRSPM